jgi:DNA-binding NarL/FixJ family response regulator
MNKPIRILIVDDHTLVREGMRAVIDLEPDMHIVAEAADGLEAVNLAQRLQPDVILMDVLMPRKDGVEATADILRQNSAARILIVTSMIDVEQIFPTIRAGALGYIAKNTSSAELLGAIRTLHQGGVHLPANLARRMLQGNAAHSPIKVEPLTDREAEILKWVAQGLGNDEIAARLVISTRTVGVHVGNILGKLGLENRTQAALYALRHGLVSLYPADSPPESGSPSESGKN